MRDSQRSKVYKADCALDQFSTRYETTRECERFIKHVWKLKRVQKAFPVATRRYQLPNVKPGCGARIAWANRWHVSLPIFARTSGIIIHELAHTISQREHGIDLAGHGWQYCAVYLRLTLLVMGREAHDALKAAFKQHRVKFRPPRTRTITTEQRAVLVERMTAARLMKRKPKSRFAVLDL